MSNLIRHIPRGHLKTFEAGVLLRIGIEAQKRKARYDHIIAAVFSALAFEAFLNELADRGEDSRDPAIRAAAEALSLGESARLPAVAKVSLAQLVVLQRVSRS